eukprot:364362-Chlamydomonas_euryale.AAC.29
MALETEVVFRTPFLQLTLGPELSGGGQKAERGQRSRHIEPEASEAAAAAGPVGSSSLPRAAAAARDSWLTCRHQPSCHMPLQKHAGSAASASYVLASKRCIRATPVEARNSSSRHSPGPRVPGTLVRAAGVHAHNSCRRARQLVGARRSRRGQKLASSCALGVDSTPWTRAAAEVFQSCGTEGLRSHTVDRQWRSCQVHGFSCGRRRRESARSTGPALPPAHTRLGNLKAVPAEGAPRPLRPRC